MVIIAVGLLDVYGCEWLRVLSAFDGYGCTGAIDLNSPDSLRLDDLRLKVDPSLLRGATKSRAPSTIAATRRRARPASCVPSVRMREKRLMDLPFSGGCDGGLHLGTSDENAVAMVNLVLDDLRGPARKALHMPRHGKVLPTNNDVLVAGGSPSARQ